MRKPARIVLATMTLAVGVSLAVASTASAAAPTTVLAAHAATPAHVNPFNNDGADIFYGDDGQEVPEVPAASCPTEYVCVYTDPNYQGQMFQLWYCGEYVLDGWTQEGSIRNSETNDDTAYTEYSPGDVDVDIRAGYGVANWNSYPDNYIVPC